MRHVRHLQPTQVRHTAPGLTQVSREDEVERQSQPREHGGRDQRPIVKGEGRRE